MKKLIILSFLFIVTNKCYTHEIKYPSPIGYINDFANVIPDNYETGLSRLIHELKQKTNGAEIAVVTIQSIAPLQIEEYAVRLYEKWGIGKKGEDNGVLVLLALKERKIRIEVGYGLEGVLPDGKCGEIIDRLMLPYFRQGDLGKGITYGTLAIIQIVAKEYGVQLEGGKGYTHSRQKRHTASPLQTILFFLLLPFIIIGRVLFFPFALLSGGYWYRGGSFGMGGFGGGFGGFGGGLSGGAGATRGW
jgi:uncharacterized protein